MSDLFELGAIDKSYFGKMLEEMAERINKDSGFVEKRMAAYSQQTDFEGKSFVTLLDELEAYASEI